MSKKLISAEVLVKMMDLPLDAIKSAIASGGGCVAGSFMDTGNKEHKLYIITAAKFRGMMSNGAFVYNVEGHMSDGSELPAHIKEFKVGVEFDPKLAKRITESFANSTSSFYADRAVGADCVVYWK